jgi:CheY-like chemotaxis protein
VTVTHAVDGTYYATLTLRRRRGASLELDARPSDAIALALRANAPIYASADLLAPLPQWEPTPLVEPKRVLLATADAGTSNLITQALRDKGHTVEVASTGEAARQALRENRFDGIMADWNLPDSSGHRLLQTAKEIQAGIPTIVLKAADDTLIREDADLWRVPDGFATKPLGVDTLLRTVARAIGTRKDGASDRKPDG